MSVGAWVTLGTSALLLLTSALLMCAAVWIGRASKDVQRAAEAQRDASGSLERMAASLLLAVTTVEGADPIAAVRAAAVRSGLDPDRVEQMTRDGLTMHGLGEAGQL